MYSRWTQNLRQMTLALLSSTILLTACGDKPASTAAVPAAKNNATPVRVSSKIDTEGGLLGNIISLALQDKGIAVTEKLQLGATKVVREALIAGEVDIYPEYTGNGAFFLSDEKNPAWKDAQAGYELVRKLDGEKNKLAWLTAAPANNTWVIALRQDVAQANHLATLDDLGKYLSAKGAFKLAASAEFVERPDALPSFEKAYGFKLNQEQILTLSGGDTAVFIKAAAAQTSGVNAALAYGTDGALASMGLTVLSDTKSVQPIYAPAPVVRAQVLAQHPEIEAILKPVFASLDLITLQQLNAQIAIEGKDAKQVASAYLKGKGLIK